MARINGTSRESILGQVNGIIQAVESKDLNSMNQMQKAMAFVDLRDAERAIEPFTKDGSTDAAMMLAQVRGNLHMIAMSDAAPQASAKDARARTITQLREGTWAGYVPSMQNGGVGQ